MKILSAQQLKNVELNTVKSEGIQLIDLMERAATAVFEILKISFNLCEKSFVLLCGSGNNGGDALVLARLLADENASIEVFLMNSEVYSNDNLVNQKKLIEKNIQIQILNEDTELDFSNESIIIDGLFGYGLNRSIDEKWKNLFQKMNEISNFKISIDLPSGMYSDQLNADEDLIFQADWVFSFHQPKLSLLLKENLEKYGEFSVLDLNFNPSAIQKEECELIYVDKEWVKSYQQKRKKNAYKYNFGNVLMIGGSYGKTGAVYLSSKACLRAGAGLVTAYVPKCGYTVLQTSIPELMLMTDFSKDKIIGFPDVSRFDTLAIGPGLGTDPKTAYAFEQFLDETDLTNKKIIIDADGINLLSQNPHLIQLLPSETILTPHDKELERLIGKWENSIEKIEKIKNFCKKYHLIIVSKGAFSQIISSKGEVYINSTGNPGMATAGSGDVLTGLIAGNLAKGMTAIQAAVYSVYWHGLSGDLASVELGQECLIATDLIEYLPKAGLDINSINKFKIP